MIAGPADYPETDTNCLTLCRKATAICLHDCVLSASLLKQLGQQLHGCQKLHSLDLQGVETLVSDLSETQELPDELFKAISTLHSLTCLVIHLPFQEHTWNTTPEHNPSTHTSISFKCYFLSPVKSQILGKGLLCLGKLQILDLEYCPLQTTGQYITEAINAWPNDPQLREVNLMHCNMPSTVTGGLMQAFATRCHKLERLNLCGNDLGGQVAALTSHTNPALEYLPFWMCKLQPDDGYALAAAIQDQKLPKLQHMDFQDNPSLTEEAVVAILNATSLHLQTGLIFYLHQFKIFMDPMDPKKYKPMPIVATQLLQAVPSCSDRLTQLILYDDLGDKLAALTTKVYPVLKNLTCKKCNLQPADGQALVDAIQQHRLPQLTNLNISDNPSMLAKDGIAALICAIVNQPQTTLEIDMGQYISLDNGCLLSRKGHTESQCEPALEGIMQVLSSGSHRLKELDLSGNNLGGHVTKITSQAHALLWKLQLSTCNLEPVDGYGIATAIQDQRLPQLKELDVMYNPSLDKETEAAILSAVLNLHRRNQIIRLNHFDQRLNERQLHLANIKTRGLLPITRSGLQNALTIRCHQLEELILIAIDLAGQVSALSTQTYPLLKIIRLIRCNILAADYHALATAVKQHQVPQLEDFTLEDDNLTYELEILTSVTFPQLRILSLHMQRADCHTLANAVKQDKFPLLEELTLDHNNLSNQMATLTSVIYPALKKLMLRGCHLQVSDCYALEAASREHKFPQLEELGLDYNNMHDKLTALTSQPQRGIKKLLLRSCSLKASDGFVLAAALQQQRLPDVGVLDLQNNPSLSEEGVAAILDAALTHHQMELEINLLGCVWDLGSRLSDRVMEEWEQKCHDTLVRPKFRVTYT